MQTATTAPLLRVENLKMHFPHKKSFLGKTKSVVKAVDGVSFEVQKGKTFGLVGESGCGKTTTGKCILRINKPTDGRILYDGKDISRMSEQELKPLRRSIQLIFQDPYGSLDPRQPAASIIKEALVCDGKPHTAQELRSQTAKLLHTVGLREEMGLRYPHEMSGGQRQRLGIARALACNPALIVCDEPVSALDVSIQAQIINLFKELQRKLGLTYVFVAHDLAVVRYIADQVGIMYLGHIVEMMDARDIYTHPLHPYTKALLSAVPTTDYHEEKKRTRIVLQGEVPSPINTPPGCPFSPRCPLATDTCRRSVPTLKNVGENHQVACFHV